MKVKYLLGSIAIASIGLVVLWPNAENKVSRKYSPQNEMSSSGSNEEYGGAGGEEFFRQVRANFYSGEVEPVDALKAWDEVVKQSRKRNRSLGLQFTEMGPDNIGGRTRAILIDQDNTSKMYAGGTSGGLFVTENGGATWSPHPDFISTAYTPLEELSLHISSIAQAPNGDLYVGTGSTHEGSSRGPGKGIYVSRDGGASFSQMQSTIPSSPNQLNVEWGFVNRIEIDANGVIYAGTNQGLRVSQDQGDTWSNPIFIDPNCNIQGQGEIDDIEITDDGRVIVAHGTRVFYSDNPTVDCSYTEVSNFPGGFQRADIAIAPSDNNIMYSITVLGGFLQEVVKSTDKGETWSTYQPGAPSPLVDSTFSLFGDNGQGNYDLCIAVQPNNPDRFYVGGVQMYNIEDVWTRPAEWFFAPTSPFYVHADLHYFTFDPTDPSKLFIGSDGGIGVSSNAGESNMRFTTANRGYNVTQFYGIAITPDGRVVGGTQDNGSQLLDPRTAANSQSSFEVSGGDGFDAAVSSIGEILFTSSQFGNINRITPNGFDNVSTGGGGPFHTVIQNWESIDDPTSKDSVVFNADEIRVGIGTGDGNKRIFNGTLNPIQDAGEVIPGSIRFEAGVGGTAQAASDANGDGVIVSDATNDSIGIFDYTTNEYQFTWPVAPAQGLAIYGYLTARFDAGDTLNLISQTLDIDFNYVLQSNLEAGDSVIVQDPVQSLLVVSDGGGLAISRNALDLGALPDYTQLPGISGSPRAVEFTEDGNTMFVGGNGVVRVDGLNDWYPGVNISSVLTTTQIFSGNVTGISINPTDPNIIAVTTGLFGNPNGNVFEITNALTAASVAAASRTNLQGNLPAMPVYDAEYTNDGTKLLIGTEFGLWATEIPYNSPVEWSDESGDMANVMVLDVKQQRLPSWRADNFDDIYIGTHGRGIWTTSSLVGQPSGFDAIEGAAKFESSIKLYPNPMAQVGNVEFNLPKAANAKINVINLEGRVVEVIAERQFNQGDNTVQINVGDLPTGTYFVTVQSGELYSVSKLVVMR